MTSDALYSRACKGYMCITLHFVDRSWKMRIIVLDFMPFHSPHTVEEFQTLMMVVVEKCELHPQFNAIITDSAADIALEMCFQLQSVPNPFNLIRDNFHVRCIALVIHTTVKDFLFKIWK